MKEERERDNKERIDWKQRERFEADVRHGFPVEFLSFGFIRRRKRARARLDVEQQMKHVDIKATRFSASNRQIYTCRESHYVVKYIFQGLN